MRNEAMVNPMELSHHILPKVAADHSPGRHLLLQTHIEMIYLASFCFCFLFLLFNLFAKLWWTPIRVQNLMASQGIKGPRYRFLHGTTKELLSKQNKAAITPMGLSHDIFPAVLPHTHSWIKQYGRNLLSWMGPQPQLIVTDPELVKLVMHNRDGAFEKLEKKGLARKFVGDGLGTTRGEKWRRQRKLANHAFGSERLKGMTPAMIVSAEMMLQRWTYHAGKEIEVFQEFRILTSDVISRTAFGSCYLEGKIVFDMVMKIADIFHRNTNRIRFPGFGKLVKRSDDIEADRLNQRIRDSVMKLIRKREERVLSGEAANFGTDFLGLLVNSSHSDDFKKKISVEDIIDECKTFYFAGQETTSSLLSWTVLLLAIHADWQEKAREEVLGLFGKENPNPHSISRLETMGMIINESLRLYSPIANPVRKAKRDVRLGELLIPANMEVVMPSLALHHNPKIWGEDAHMFKPERFAQGVAKATNNIAAAFIPFGLGPRTCVGLNFAVNEAKIVLLMILQRYRLTLSPNYVHSPVLILTLRPRLGIHINLHSL